MINVPTWISRMSAVALATASVSAFAAAPNAPDYVMHQANVNFKVSDQGTSKIDTTTYKTKNLINVLMGRSVDAKNEKDEKLGLVTACAADDEAVTLVVFDKKSEEVKSGSSTVTLDITNDVVELDKNNNLKKADLLFFTGDESGFLNVTGQARFAKIGNRCAKDGDNKDYWDKDSICAKNFKSKSVTGEGLFGEIVMSGKVSAGSCKFAFDDPTPNPVMTINKTNDVDGELSMPATGDATINYTIVVENTGNVALTNVVVSDLTVDGEAVTCADGAFDNTLGVNDSVTCTATTSISQTEFDAKCATGGTGSVRNIATVSSNEASSQATANLVDLNCTTDPTGGLAIVKTSDKDDTSVNAGDDITYTITVTNQSSAEATNVLVDDTLLDLGDGLTCDPVEGSSLAIDAVMTCTGTHTVTEQDVVDNCGAEGDGTIRNIASSTSDELDNFATDNLVDVNCP